MVLDDRRVKVKEITDILGISRERVRYILHQEFNMRKLCARWVPHLLTIDQKRIRMRISQACLDRFQQKKVMATVFWDYKNVLLIDYIQKGKTNLRILL